MVFVPSGGSGRGDLNRLTSLKSGGRWWWAWMDRLNCVARRLIDSGLDWSHPHSQTCVSRRAALKLFGGSAIVAALLPPRALGAVAEGVGSSRVGDFDAQVANEWFDLSLRLIRGTPGYSPPVASRAIGYSGVVLYEGLVAGMPGYRPLAGLVNGLESFPSQGGRVAYHWPAVANRALAQMNRWLFPTAPLALRIAIDDLENRLACGPAGGPRGLINRSVDRGGAVAEWVFKWSRGDGGDQGYLRNFPLDYIPPLGPGVWVSTPPGYLPALQPWWGRNRRIVPGIDPCMPGPPPAYSRRTDSALFAEALEVYEVVSKLSAEQRAVALFWSDDPVTTATPSGHSVSILAQVLRASDASLAIAAEAYARVGLALSDAFVTCWATKYHYNLLRPITYIRDAIDPAWGDPGGPHPLPLITPPFPEYTSGHSVQSGAAATVLAALFGDRPFTDHTHDERGLAPRNFVSFTAAADEAALSRLYGGIHYRSAITRGLEQGRCVGSRVVALPLRA